MQEHDRPPWHIVCRGGFSYFFIEKKFAKKTLVFSLVYSFSYLFLQKIGLEFVQYNAQGHDTIFHVIISGAIAGFTYGVCLKNNASTGGTDIVSRYINKVKPETNFFFVTFIINAVVAFASLFVYSEGGNLDYKPVALCITYCFISNFVGNYIIKGTKTAYKYDNTFSFCELVTETYGNFIHVK